MRGGLLRVLSRHIGLDIPENVCLAPLVLAVPDWRNWSLASPTGPYQPRRSHWSAPCPTSATSSARHVSLISLCSSSSASQPHTLHWVTAKPRVLVLNVSSLFSLLCAAVPSAHQDRKKLRAAPLERSPTRCAPFVCARRMQHAQGACSGRRRHPVPIYSALCAHCRASSSQSCGRRYPPRVGRWNPRRARLAPSLTDIALHKRPARLLLPGVLLRTFARRLVHRRSSSLRYGATRDLCFAPRGCVGAFALCEAFAPHPFLEDLRRSSSSQMGSSPCAARGSAHQAP
ncbi:hypothetical protein C8J57DRAFT_1715639, partial [Mycena rebaudengoi]